MPDAGYYVKEITVNEDIALTAYFEYVEPKLIDYWELTSQENFQNNNLTIYRGSEINFSDEGMYLRNTVISTKNQYLLPEKFTVSFKYKPTEDLTTRTQIIGKNTAYAETYQYNGLWISPDTSYLDLYTGNQIPNRQIDTSKVIQKDKFSTITFICNGRNRCKLYSNGKLLLNREEKYNDFNTNLYIGGSVYSGTGAAGVSWGYANGYFKDVRIYEGALSQEEIHKIE